MADKILTVPFHIGDLIKDTWMMDAAEFGAYMRLLMLHYDIGVEGIPDDEEILRKHAGCSLKVWRRVRVVVLKKFAWKDAVGIHKRVVEEILKCQVRVSNSRNNGLKNKKTQKPVGMPQVAHGGTNQLTINKLTIPPNPQGESAGFNFDEVWEYVWDRGEHPQPRPAAEKAYRLAIEEGIPHEEILNAVKLRAGVQNEGTQYAPQFSTWLNERRWRDSEKRPVSAEELEASNLRIEKLRRENEERLAAAREATRKSMGLPA